MIFSPDISVIFRGERSHHNNDSTKPVNVLLDNSSWRLFNTNKHWAPVLGGLSPFSTELGASTALDLPHSDPPPPVALLWVQCNAFNQIKPADSRYF